MSKSRSPLIIDTIHTNRAQEISKAIEGIDFSRQKALDLIEKLQLAVLTGAIKLSKTEQTILRDMARKYIPDAPKEVYVEQKVRVEEYIIVAMENNVDSYRRLQDEARKFAELEEAKARDLYEQRDDNKSRGGPQRLVDESD